MASFPEFMRAIEREGVKRFTYICGPDRFLVERAVDECRRRCPVEELFDVRLSAAETPSKDIWAAMNEYPANPGLEKLVIVRDVQSLKNWEPFVDWLASRHIPQIHVVFVSSEREWKKDEDRVEQREKLMKSLQAVYVYCTSLNEVDAIEFLVSPSFQREQAKYLLTRLGGDIAAASDFVAKVERFHIKVTPALIDKLVLPNPNDDFVNALLHLEKDKAMTALADVPTYAYSSIIDRLDKRLVVLAKLNKVQRYMTARELSMFTGETAYMSGLLRSAAKHYDAARVRRCVEALAFVDGRLRDGNDGLFEVLVSLW